jgi:hypothetical protein
MNKVLSLLLSFVFLQTQAWALSGGPVFGGGAGNLNVIGTYGGVLIPNLEDAVGDDDEGTGTSASIGVFSLGVQETGPATGTAVVFVEGTAYNGTITGIVDPLRATLQAIIQATSNFDVVRFIRSVDEEGNVIITESRTKIFAQGNVNARVFELFGTSGFGASQLTTRQTGGTRIEGVASIDLFSRLNNDASPNISKSVSFDVDGFKQSDSVAAGDVSFTGFEF